MDQRSARSEGAVQPNALTHADATQSALFVSSFEKGLRVLETIGKVGESLSLSDVAERAGLDRSAAQRFTYTLHTLGYLIKDPLTKRYCLGPKSLELGSAYRRWDELITRSMPLLVECNTTSGETVCLARLDGQDVVYLFWLPGRHAAGIHIAFGSRLPASRAALGQAILSFTPRDKVRQPLAHSAVKTNADHEIIGSRDLGHRIAEIRDQGFAVACEEPTAGDISVAAPVFDHSKSAIAAVGITVSVSRGRWTAEQARQSLGPVVCGLSNRISDFRFPS